VNLFIFSAFSTSFFSDHILEGNRYIFVDKERNNLGKIFDKHLEFEFEKEDVDATMTTMTEDPYVHHVPTLTGGRGYS